MEHKTMFRNSYSAYRGYKTTPLSMDYIKAVAPSVFAENKHESRSDRYTYIPTSVIVEALMREGFMPYYAAQGNSRIPGKSDFTKHLLKFRKDSVVNEDTSEINLLNSHDGTTNYVLFLGRYRLACANGLMYFDKTMDIKVPHRGNIIDNVIEGAYTILSHEAEIESSVDKLRSIQLSRPEQLAYSQAALALKYDTDDNGKLLAPISADMANAARRSADYSGDLWTTFNRVQENLIKGGQRGRNANNGRTTTRAVTGIDGNVKLNRALWMLADSMANIKLAA